MATNKYSKTINFLSLCFRCAKFEASGHLSTLIIDIQRGSALTPRKGPFRVNIVLSQADEVILEFVGALPYLAETNGDVEAIEDGQRHRHVRDDGPRPDSIKVKLRRVDVSSRCLESADRPHGEVAHEQKGHLERYEVIRGRFIFTKVRVKKRRKVFGLKRINVNKDDCHKFVEEEWGL